MARVGILGSAFNPPHLGHLLLAQEARIGLGLDSVLLVPTARPPHKALEDDPGAEVRAELCELAAAGDPTLEVSRVELEREGPSFTVDTLRGLSAQRPGDEWTLLMGADQAEAFARWRDPAGVVALARLGVVARDGVGDDALLARLAEVPGAADRATRFAMPRFDVSSTRVRERVRRGIPIRRLVPDAVAARIAADGLYRS